MIQLYFLRRSTKPWNPGSIGCFSAANQLALIVRCSHTLPAAPRIASLITSEDTAEARTWITKFKRESIPRGSVNLTFSKSSGPGGQNVNKVNTKATLRCPIDSAWIPIWAQPHLKQNPHYAASTNSILITSTVHRSQSENIEDCLSKLHYTILTAASAPIKTETSAEQKKRVETLERIEKARRRLEKSHRSEVKKNRKSGGPGAWD